VPGALAEDVGPSGGRSLYRGSGGGPGVPGGAPWAWLGLAENRLGYPRAAISVTRCRRGISGWLVQGPSARTLAPHHRLTSRKP